MGRQSGSAAAISAGEATTVIWVPNTSWKYRAVMRSAMCADGRNEVIRSPNSIGSTLLTARASASRAAWVDSTPFGSPVVPEV
ncbi:hypothetical protein JOF56_004822 [Kibdelosporangium banguiense]|uniref:Uncharacterized protein n=1 Tax=Kibdelosporangium banguiense TaxID=1365924 RepID=A0ABS4TJ42_9PSEU|nr:hypothetical protein [Kibdelosporangium banguiense]